MNLKCTTNAPFPPHSHPPTTHSLFNCYRGVNSVIMWLPELIYPLLHSFHRIASHHSSSSSSKFINGHSHTRLHWYMIAGNRTSNECRSSEPSCCWSWWTERSTPRWLRRRRVRSTQWQCLSHFKRVIRPTITWNRSFRHPSGRGRNSKDKLNGKEEEEEEHQQTHFGNHSRRVLCNPKNLLPSSRS